jgi:predicted nucleotidyltransferase
MKNESPLRSVALNNPVDPSIVRVLRTLDPIARESELASSIPIEIEENLIVRVVSIPGLMLLKLVAWSDRGRETDKDAADIYRLLTSYADAGNTDRLYDHEMDLLETVGFDMDLAGAELLGRDDARLCSPPALALVQSVLEPEPIFERLANQMVQTSTVAESVSFVVQLLMLFRRGLRNVGDRPETPEGIADVK